MVQELLTKCAINVLERFDGISDLLQNRFIAMQNLPVLYIKETKSMLMLCLSVLQIVRIVDLLCIKYISYGCPLKCVALHLKVSC